MAHRSGATQRRINISLSEESVRLLDQFAQKGDRSRLIQGLIRKTARERAELRRLMRERAVRARHRFGLLDHFRRDREQIAILAPQAPRAYCARSRIPPPPPRFPASVYSLPATGPLETFLCVSYLFGPP
jgi:hypothetical protein